MFSNGDFTSVLIDKNVIECNVKYNLKNITITTEIDAGVSKYIRCNCNDRNFVKNRFRDEIRREKSGENCSISYCNSFIFLNPTD